MQRFIIQVAVYLPNIHTVHIICLKTMHVTQLQVIFPGKDLIKKFYIYNKEEENVVIYKYKI